MLRRKYANADSHMVLFQECQQHNVKPQLLDQRRRQNGGVFAISVLIDQHFKGVARILARLPNLGNRLHQCDHQVKPFPYIETNGHFFDFVYEISKYGVISGIVDVGVIRSVVERARE